MKKRIRIFICILLGSAAAALNALNFDSDFYDFLSELYGVDENAGLTAFPLLNIPMGGRAEGMAGAFAAVCDDISFIDWNPAGSAMLSKTEFAVFHNNWIADTKIESAVFATRFARWGLSAAAKWLYTPFTEYDEWGDRASKGYYSEITGTLNASYNFFPGYYYPGFSVGLNLKGALRATPDFADYTAASQSAAGFAADAGILTRVNLLKFYDSRDKNMSFALVMRNCGPPVQDEALPTLAVAGVSWRPLRPLLAAFDFSYPLNLQAVEYSEKPFCALGLSAMLTRFLSMRGGALLKTGSARITLGSSVEIGAAAVEVNYTLDLATQVQPLSRVTIGVRLDLGDGGRTRNAQLVDQYYLTGLDAYSHGEDEKAMENFTQALKLDPYFDPAREGIAAVKRFRELQQRIRLLQSLE